MEYKVGDRVKLIKKSCATDGFEVGKIYKISCVSDDSFLPIYIINELGRHGYVDKEHIEPCEQQEITTHAHIDGTGINICTYESLMKEGENDMNKVLELYCEKAERTIENDYDEMTEEERNENPFVKEYYELINEFEVKMDDLYKREMDENGDHHVFVNKCCPIFYQFDIDYDFTNENIEHYEECKKAELQDLEEFKQEVSAKLSLSDDLDYTLKVLKEYGIINKKTGKLESYFTELDEQNEV